MRSVLVTGGTTRLGRAIAARLSCDGWRVLTSSHRSGAGADFLADLTREGAADELFDAVCAELGHAPEALVNNAALFTGPEADLLRLNREAPRRLVERMAEAGGSVVNILDAAILAPSSAETKAGVAYRTSKRALAEDVRTLSVRHAPQLRLNGVAPGPVLAPEGVHEPSGRMLTVRPTPEDVAGAVAFLLATPSVTGVILPVDAGQHLVGR